ncbi:hypothetical protein GUJ93_ZPchr0005g16351 [Zizania palustris]|uniref:Uncharacterized protein n=1 Tax=Zizania palustris TaxID=103762 RepID=A0A8J5S2W8_ZIZPA|nr:hypothetical protein GUJ93_ZPchr0005g16351 [Zizania palustris]
MVGKSECFSARIREVPCEMLDSPVSCSRDDEEQDSRIQLMMRSKAVQFSDKNGYKKPSSIPVSNTLERFMDRRKLLYCLPRDNRKCFTWQWMRSSASACRISGAADRFMSVPAAADCDQWADAAVADEDEPDSWTRGRGRGWA